MWTIKGQSGLRPDGQPWTLDAIARTLEELAITSAYLDFQSLAGDSVRWTAATLDATGAGTIVPDAGQIVELWKDGVRKFRGHVTGIRAGMDQITITAEGPWWWLERTNLTSDQTSAGGTTAERPVYVFPTGDLKTHLEALIDRAIANGVPMARGTVAAAYAIPQATLAAQPCSEALATLLAWMPDSVAWFDYSGATPTLNIGRRGDFTATTYTLGTDAVEQGELTPRLDLEVTRNELHYVTRNATTGMPEWATQASGTYTPGKRQIVAVSGPEIVDFLPRDDFDSSYITAPGHSSDPKWIVWLGDQGLGPAIGSGHLSSTAYGALQSGIGNYQAGQWPTQVPSFSPIAVAPTRCIYSDGSAASGYISIQRGIPDWAVTAAEGRRGRVVGTWVAAWLDMYGAMPGWFQQLISGSTTGRCYPHYTSKYTSTTVYSVEPATYLARAINMECIFFPGPIDGTVYKPWEYSYLTPPAGLAANLVAAQNWVPWEGPLTLVADDCSGDNLLPAKYNLANSLPPCAAMGALARGVSHDLMRGRTTIELGAPARLDFGTLVSRIRREPKDNIVYL